LALIGYWTACWVVITIEEEFLFRRKRGGYDWTAWNNRQLLPIGFAALGAFLVGWLGAVLGMWQTYFTGPLAQLVGDGIDMGMPVSASWTAIVYPGSRWLELKYIGK
jgi:purine-cytosine permease-like protein